jgi:fermentation-respiration switch protein FrsA (DUF1100 family)
MKRALKSFVANSWRNTDAGWRLARIVSLLAAVGLTLIIVFESRFIYFPSKYPEGDWRVREPRAVEGRVSVRVEDVWLTAADGVRLHAWHAAPVVGRGGALEPVAADRTLLYLHGNAGNISHRHEIIERFASLPAHVLALDYRGYGRSDGSPSEEGLYADARAAFDHLTKERGVPPNRVVIYGESLGGAVAVDLASKVQPCALIIQSSFTSIADMAAEVMPFVPRFVIRTKMDSLEKIARVRAPILVVHSPADDVVPYRLGRRLYEAAPEPKRFYEIKNAPHNLTFDIGGAAYINALREFVDSSCK